MKRWTFVTNEYLRLAMKLAYELDDLKWFKVVSITKSFHFKSVIFEASFDVRATNLLVIVQQNMKNYTKLYIMNRHPCKKCFLLALASVYGMVV